MNGAGSEELSFTFEGRRVPAKRGQSIAGALHASGVSTLSRGVKYHRPRGYTCGFGACGDCPLRIDGMPLTVSCTTPVEGGERVRREGAFPGAGFDLLRTADLMRPLLKAGFQFKLFAGQPRLSKLAGAVLAILAGGGRMPSAAAVARGTITRVERVAAPVLVIGGGVSGLAAALAAAEAGLEVVVVDRDFLGGRSQVRTEQIRNGQTRVRPDRVFPVLLGNAERHPRIRLIRGLAVGLIDGLVPVVSEREGARTEISPEALMIATGSYETPILVPGHDLPGAMLADAALKLAAVEGVPPGRRAVVVDGDPRASEVARELSRLGVEVVAQVPAKSVASITGWSRATGVRLRGGGVEGGTRSARAARIRADLVCIVGPRRPAEELALHAAYASAGSHDLVLRDAPALAARTVVVGTAAGDPEYSLTDISRRARQLAGEIGAGSRSDAAPPQPAAPESHRSADHTTQTSSTPE